MSTLINMQKSDMFSVVFLCVINVIFIVAGIFLNSVVIISLWRSSQLRKKLCYFMIFVLSCFGHLAVVAIMHCTHPFLIVSTIFFSLGEIDEIRELTRVSISFILHGSSLFALFTVNVERFLALTCPFFDQTSVTKTRLVCFLAFLTVTLVGLWPLQYSFEGKTISNILAAVTFLSLLFLFIYLNYKMFKIAKSKREDERVVPTTATMDANRKTRILNLKSHYFLNLNISICSLAVGCFFVCSCPQIIYSALRLASETPFYDRQVLLFNMWANTFVSMNSTFNCVIFFWRNSILRREGMKIANAFRLHVAN